MRNLIYVALFAQLPVAAMAQAKADTTLQKKFLNDKLVAQIGWSNPFIHRNASMSRVIQGDYTGFNNSHSRAQSVSLTISWNFGKLKAQVKKADTTIQNDDVVGGVKK